ARQALFLPVSASVNRCALLRHDQSRVRAQHSIETKEDLHESRPFGSLLAGRDPVLDRAVVQRSVSVLRHVPEEDPETEERLGQMEPRGDNGSSRVSAERRDSMTERNTRAS